MTREEFVKISFKAYKPINYVAPRTKNTIECLLVAVHFDRELLTLSPLDTVEYVDEDFIVHIKDCYIPVKANNE